MEFSRLCSSVDTDNHKCMQWVKNDAISDEICQQTNKIEQISLTWLNATIFSDSSVQMFR